MKIVKSINTPFEFAFDRQNTVYIGAEGTTVSDTQAKVLSARFGKIITIEEATLEETVESAKVEETAPVEATLEEKPSKKNKK